MTVSKIRSLEFRIFKGDTTIEYDSQDNTSYYSQILTKGERGPLGVTRIPSLYSILASFHHHDSFSSSHVERSRQIARPSSARQRSLQLPYSLLESLLTLEPAESFLDPSDTILERIEMRLKFIVEIILQRNDQTVRSTDLLLQGVGENARVGERIVERREEREESGLWIGREGCSAGMRDSSLTIRCRGGIVLTSGRVGMRTEKGAMSRIGRGDSISKVGARRSRIHRRYSPSVEDDSTIATLMKGRRSKGRSHWGGSILIEVGSGFVLHRSWDDSLGRSVGKGEAVASRLVVRDVGVFRMIDENGLRVEGLVATRGMHLGRESGRGVVTMLRTRRTLLLSILSDILWKAVLVLFDSAHFDHTLPTRIGRRVSSTVDRKRSIQRARSNVGSNEHRRRVGLVYRDGRSSLSSSFFR